MIWGGNPRSFPPAFSIRGYEIGGRVRALLALRPVHRARRRRPDGRAGRCSSGARPRAADARRGVRAGGRAAARRAGRATCSPSAGRWPRWPARWPACSSRRRSSSRPTTFDAVLVFGFTAAVSAGWTARPARWSAGVVLGLALSYVSGYCGRRARHARRARHPDRGPDGAARTACSRRARSGGSDVTAARATWRSPPARRRRAVAAQPARSSPFDNLQLATMAYSFVAVAGLTVLTGLNGQISLGHGALMAVGAYATASCSARAAPPGRSPWCCSRAALVTARGRRCSRAAAAARLRGPYLAGRDARAGRRPARPSPSASRASSAASNGLTVAPPIAARGRSARPSRSSAGRRGSPASAALDRLRPAGEPRPQPARARLPRRARRRGRRAARGPARGPHADPRPSWSAPPAPAWPAGCSSWSPRSPRPARSRSPVGRAAHRRRSSAGSGSLVGAVWGAAALVLIPTWADDLSKAPLAVAPTCRPTWRSPSTARVLIGVMLAAPRGIQGAARPCREFVRGASRPRPAASRRGRRRRGHEVTTRLLAAACAAALVLGAAACGSSDERRGRRLDRRQAHRVGAGHHRDAGHRRRPLPAHRPGRARLQRDPAGINAYFQYVNANGGVHGRKLKMIVRDDGYNPTNTVKVTKQLVLQDKVFAMLGGLGTPTHTKVVDFLNASRVPDLFVSSGCLCWDEPEKHPVDLRLAARLLHRGQDPRASTSPTPTRARRSPTSCRTTTSATDGAKGLDKYVPSGSGRLAPDLRAGQHRHRPADGEDQGLRRPGHRELQHPRLHGAREARGASSSTTSPQLVVSNVGSDPTTLKRAAQGLLEGQGAGALIDGIADRRLPAVAGRHLERAGSCSSSKIHDQYLSEAPARRQRRLRDGRGVHVRRSPAAGRAPTRRAQSDREDDRVGQADRAGARAVPLQRGVARRLHRRGHRQDQERGAARSTGKPMVTDDGDGAITEYTKPPAKAPSSGVPAS